MGSSLESVFCRSVLVIGGVRSGKSRYALALAEATAAERLYLATAEAGDAEMAERIARHRGERGTGWRTREEPLALASALRAEARPGRATLVDCLTLWLANLMQADLNIEAQISELTKVLSELDGPAILISNEVGAWVEVAFGVGLRYGDAHGLELVGHGRVGGGV